MTTLHVCYRTHCKLTGVIVICHVIRCPTHTTSPAVVWYHLVVMLSFKKRRIESEASQVALVWHILRMDEESKVKQTMNNKCLKIAVRGSTGAKGKQKMRWMFSIRHDMNKYGLEETDAQEKMEMDGTEHRPGPICMTHL